jgi:hypothetical protein
MLSLPDIPAPGTILEVPFSDRLLKKAQMQGGERKAE